MDAFFENFIQIAGVLDADDLAVLVDSGVRYIGFPLRLGYHTPDITEEEAAELIETFPEDVVPILITYENDVSSLVDFCRKLNVSVVQIHGDMDVMSVSEFRKLCPDFKIIKSLIVGKFSKEELLRKIDAYGDFVDAFITDTYDSETSACGATGKTHDWQITCELNAYSKKPVILAGGLNPDNVCKAIESTGVRAVDVHTGVEDGTGKKNPRLVSEFVSESKQGFGIN